MSTHTTESLMDLVEEYADGPHLGGYYGAYRKALQSAITELVAERDADKKYIRELEDAVTPELVALRAERDALKDLLQEVSRNFTRDDDLPDNLLPRIDSAMKGPTP